ncbi:MAG: redoxin domain-containing protein, partial [Prosthecobacter sp.]
LKAFTAAPAGQPAHDVTRLRAQGLAAYHQNDAKLLAASLKELEAITIKVEDKKDGKDTKEEKPAGEKLVKADTSKAKAAPAETKSRNAAGTPARKDAPVATQAAKPAPKPPEKPEVKAKNNAVAELKALIALLDAKTPKADKAKLLDALKDTDTPKDRVARYWLKLDDKTKAADLAKNFNQDLAGLAAKTEILQACGKTDDAKKAFEDTRKQAFAMDRDLPVAKRLDSLAKTFAISGDWPVPAPKRSDSGKRPDISTLGPVHWSPPAAPVFEALTLDNQHVKSTDFTEKKPTLFLFYLGHECSHCVEQMQAFAKVAKDFDTAGIQLVGVTIEPTQIAGKIREKLQLSKDAPLPFPILSDSSQAAFKVVRAYDDFENELLHAAILIDPAGKQRWQDVSWQPFKDTKFMLEEAKRLLGNN